MFSDSPSLVSLSNDARHRRHIDASESSFLLGPWRQAANVFLMYIQRCISGHHQYLNRRVVEAAGEGTTLRRFKKVLGTLSLSQIISDSPSLHFSVSGVCLVSFSPPYR